MFSEGVQGMGVFGNEKDDYELIWDFIVIDNNDTIRDNIKLFIVNKESKKIELKSDSLLF